MLREKESNMKTALDIAQYFINHSYGGQLDDVTNLKLQKLLYYAQGYNLALYDEPLFDEDIENWSHGTVVPCVYHEFKCFGKQIIVPNPNFDMSKFSKQVKDVLEIVCSDYAKFPALKLRQMTHNESPWKNTQRDEVITKQSIKSFFKTKLNCEQFNFDLERMDRMLDTNFVKVPHFDNDEDLIAWIESGA